MSKQGLKKIQQKLLSSVQVEQIDNARLVYSLAQKQSESGVFNNKRLLVLNTRDAVIGYSNNLPIKIPFQSWSNMVQLKKKVDFSAIEFAKIKSNILEITCRQVNYKMKKKKEIWMFIFKIPDMVEGWISELMRFRQQLKGNKMQQQLFPEKNEVFTRKVQVMTTSQTPLIPSQMIPIVNKPLETDSDKKNSIIIQSSMPANLNKSNENLYGTKLQKLESKMNFENKEDQILIQSLSNNQLAKFPSDYHQQEQSQALVMTKNSQKKSYLPNKEIQDRFSENYNNFQDQQTNLQKSKINDTDQQHYIPKSKIEPGLINSKHSFSNNTNNPYVFDNEEPSLNKPNSRPPSKTISNYHQNKLSDNPQNEIHEYNRQNKSIKEQSQYNNDSVNNNSIKKNLISKNVKELKEYLKTNQTNNQMREIKEETQIPISNAESADWNLEFYSTKDHIKTMMRFKKKAESIVKRIIDDSMNNSNFREQEPVYEDEKSASYEIDGLFIKIAYSVPNNNSNQELLFDESEIKKIKNEWRNYNYFMKVTQNQGLFRVPLSCIVNYKGLYCLVKAVIQDFSELSANEIITQLTKLQKITKIKNEIFNIKENVMLKLVSIKGNRQNINIIYLDNFNHYLPYDLSSVQRFSQFRYQILQECNIAVSGEVLNYDRKVDKIIQKNISELDDVQQKVRSNCQKLLNEIQSLELLILGHIDLKRELHKQGINGRYLSFLYKNSSIQLFKGFFLSEMLASICRSLLRNHLQTQMRQISERQGHKLKIFEIDEILKEGVVNFLNDLLSNTQNTESIWRIVMIQLKKKYGVLINNKAEIEFGYFLSSFFSKLGIKVDFKQLKKDRENSKFIKSLEVAFIERFTIKIKCYDLQFTNEISEILTILNKEPTESGFDTLTDILDLREKKIPDYCQSYDLNEKIILYLANFVPADLDKELPNQYKHLQMYMLMNDVPPTLSSIKLALMAIKWAVKRKQEKVAMTIFEDTSELVTFWGGEFHPILSEFYDFFSLYYITNGEYEEAITLGKSSLVNTIKIIGANNLSTADKYYQLGNIYFKIGKKQESLTHYLKTKDILINNKRTSIPQYGIISLKLALLYLNFGKITQSIDLAYECLKIFQSGTIHQQEILETFELLARAYEITQQKNEALDLSNLCSQKLNNTEDPKIFERMMKISLYAHITNLPVASSKCLVSILESLPLNRSMSTYNQSFNYLKKRAQNEIISEVFLSYLDKIDKIYHDIVSKELIKKHKGLETEIRSEAQDFLVLLQSIVYIIQESYIMGVLKEFDYF